MGLYIYNNGVCTLKLRWVKTETSNTCLKNKAAPKDQKYNYPNQEMIIIIQIFRYFLL